VIISPLSLPFARHHSPPLSQGSFGLGLRISYEKADDSREIFVVKRNDITALGYRMILREKAFMHALDHPNIAKLHYQCVSPNCPTGEEDDTTVYFVMEDGTSFQNADKSWQLGGSSLREYALPTTLMRATLSHFSCSSDTFEPACNPKWIRACDPCRLRALCASHVTCCQRLLTWRRGMFCTE
jgi:hypothetical protein